LRPEFAAVEPDQPMSRRPRKRRVLRFVVFVAVTWILLSVCSVLALRIVDPPVTAVMLLEPGPVGAIDYRWVARERIAGTAARAVIAAEDQKFLSHRGIDLDAIGDAVQSWRGGDELRGASTITQQVAKNLFLWNGRSFLRKGLEAWFAILLDGLLPKQRILEIYLNVAEFGPKIFGVEAATAKYFGRTAAGLSQEEAAALAAALPSPKRLSVNPPSDYVRMRQREILEQMRLLEQRGHYLGLAW
jgi:monofunctional biosynthetic peptidoglycan transglycosylase